MNEDDKPPVKVKVVRRRSVSSKGKKTSDVYEEYSKQTEGDEDTYGYTKSKQVNGREKLYNFHSGSAGSEIEKSRLMGGGTKFKMATRRQVSRMKTQIDNNLKNN